VFIEIFDWWTSQDMRKLGRGDMTVILVERTGRISIEIIDLCHIFVKIHLEDLKVCVGNAKEFLEVLPRTFVD